MEWLLYIGLLMQFFGVALLTFVENLNFEWILDRIRKNSFEMIPTEEEKKLRRRRIAVLIGFGSVIGGIGFEILNAVYYHT